MSLETTLVTLLTPICPTIFYDIADFGTPAPYVTYQQIGGDAPTFIDREVPSKRCAMMQINVYATTRGESLQMMLQIESALTLTPLLQAKPEGALHADIDDDTDLRTAVQDFIIWSDR